VIARVRERGRKRKKKKLITGEGKKKAWPEKGRKHVSLPTRNEPAAGGGGGKLCAAPIEVGRRGGGGGTQINPRMGRK